MELKHIVLIACRQLRLLYESSSNFLGSVRDRYFGLTSACSGQSVHHQHGDKHRGTDYYHHDPGQTVLLHVCSFLSTSPCLLSLSLSVSVPAVVLSQAPSGRRHTRTFRRRWLHVRCVNAPIIKHKTLLLKTATVLILAYYGYTGIQYDI